MCSPLYGFTADDLLSYRMADRDGSLWRAVCKCAKENPEDEKFGHLISSLTHYRCLAEGMNVDALIYRLYNETGLLALASKHGGKDNLMLLYNYARKFEGSSFKGLYSFINYVNNVAEREDGLEDSDNKVSDANTVKIITIHSSKGLEYPIVFLSEGSRLLTNRDLTDRIAYAEEYGMSFNLRGPDGLSLVKNPMQNIIHEKINRKFYEEELRVLYVALTRARERLFVTGDLKAKSPEAYFAETAIKGRALTPYGITKLNSYLDIIMASGAGAKIEYVEDLDTDEAQNDTKINERVEVLDTTEEGGDDWSPEIYEQITSRFRYEYPDKIMTEIPEKMSVSRLYPSVLDGSEDSALILSDDTYEREAAEGEVVRRDPLPDFMTGTEADESARRGIATHMVLQFCDLENLKTNGAKAELERLCDADFLSKSNKDRVRLYEIELFARSSLFSKMLGAKNLYRELRFNCRLPATLFTKDEAKREKLRDTGILVQGVIDCLIEDNEGRLHLVDYKTDRLTREELMDVSLAQKKLNDKHSLQLSYYAMAIKKMFGREPSTVSVYSMPLGRTVPIEVKK
jgi:ATP-dependent helicase/nuclease subunit A